MTADRRPDATTRLVLSPLLPAEALHLLGQTSLGLVVCATATADTRTVGFHAIIHGELIILTLLTPELEAALEGSRPIVYQSDSIDDGNRSGGQATVTGRARFIIDSALRRHYRLTLHGFVAGPGSRVLRLRPQSIDGHRFQRLHAAL